MCVTVKPISISGAYMVGRTEGEGVRWTRLFCFRAGAGHTAVVYWGGGGPLRGGAGVGTLTMDCNDRYGSHVILNVNLAKFRPATRKENDYRVRNETTKFKSDNLKSVNEIARDKIFQI